MDGDAIGITSFAVIVFGAITAGLLWVRSNGLKRRKSLQAMTTAIGFEPIATPPPGFPLEKFAIVRWGEKGGRIFSQAARGKHLGRDVLFFDYFLIQEQGYKVVNATVSQTIVAARGGPECFPTEKTNPTLRLESAEGWTIVYKIRTTPTAAFFSADEIQALIDSIPSA